jgi:hypothetical protein
MGAALVKIGTCARTGVTVGALAGVRVGALAGPSVGALAGPSVDALTGATVVVPLDTGADTTGADLGAMVIEIGASAARDTGANVTTTATVGLAIAGATVGGAEGGSGAGLVGDLRDCHQMRNDLKSEP